MQPNANRVSARLIGAAIAKAYRRAAPWPPLADLDEIRLRELLIPEIEVLLDLEMDPGRLVGPTIWKWELRRGRQAGPRRFEIGAGGNASIAR